MASTPKLAPGAYVEITGIALMSEKCNFVLSRRGRPNHRPETAWEVSLPEVGDKPLTWVVKFYDGYILVETGKETKTHKHTFRHPARFAVRNFTTTNIEMVTSSGV